MNSIIPKCLRDFRPKKCVSFGGALSSSTYVELVRVIQRTVGLLYLGRDKLEVNFYCIGFYILPTTKGLNLLKKNKIYVPQSDIVRLYLYFYCNQNIIILVISPTTHPM